MSLNCPYCGMRVLDDRVMSAKAKIFAAIKAGQPISAGEVAKRVYGRNDRKTRNRVIVNIWHMNRPVPLIVSDGVGHAAKGYSVARRRPA